MTNKDKTNASQMVSQQMNKEVLKVLEDLKTNFNTDLQALNWFYQQFRDFTDPTNSGLADKTVIATNCIYVPEELIYAAGAVPLRICNGFYSYEQAGSIYLHSKACPLVRATVGSLQINNFPFGAKPELVIIPTSCDQKKKITELEINHQIPYFLLEVPSVKSSNNAKRYWIDSILDLKKELEKITGTKITAKRLTKAINKIYRGQKEFKRFVNLRKESDFIQGVHAIMVLNTYFITEVETWTTHLKELNDEIEKRIRSNKVYKHSSKPGIVLTGSPSIFPNLKVPIITEESGAVVVADDFCSTSRMLSDTVAPDEWSMYDMIPAIADRYLNPCTCPNLIPNDDRYRKLIETVKDHKADGVIYQTFAGCHLFEIESFKTIKLLQSQGIPVLAVETGYGSDDIGQLTTRIEAFIESLNSRK